MLKIEAVDRETVMKNVRIFHQELSVGFEIIQVYHPNKVPLEKVEPLSMTPKLDKKLAPNSRFQASVSSPF